MRYYEKLLSSTPTTASMNFDHLWRQLDFRDLITYPANQRALDTWRNAFEPGAPDLAAAVFAQIHYRQPLNGLLLQALQYCELMVEELAYEPTSAQILSQQADLSLNHVALVAGCQGRESLNSRAHAAYQLLRGIVHIPFKVVFSGKSPAKAGTGIRVQTPNEALAMDMAFRRLVDADATFTSRRNYTIALENRSSRSEENVGNFFNGPYLRTNQDAVLYLISATYHIRRLAEIAEAAVSSDQALQRVKKIVLVGAESSVDGVVTTPSYVKWMMYEVFNHLFSQPARWARVTQEPVAPKLPGTDQDGKAG